MNTYEARIVAGIEPGTWVKIPKSIYDNWVRSGKNGWIECREITAKSSQGKKDTAILDWLEKQHVEVRTPLRYGSRANFVVAPPDDEFEVYPSSLRTRCWRAMFNETKDKP